MRVMRIFSAMLLAVFAVFQSSFASLESSTVKAYQTMSGGGSAKIYKVATLDSLIYIAGQPQPAGLRQLKKLKIKAPVDLVEQNEISHSKAIGRY
ncbi:putative exported protein [Coxiella burnetii str. Namibia]|nr:putative exported protein [Coxiella burnetii str. Namibia]